jgi:hypothetical protein
VCKEAEARENSATPPKGTRPNHALTCGPGADGAEPYTKADWASTKFKFNIVTTDKFKIKQNQPDELFSPTNKPTDTSFI